MHPSLFYLTLLLSLALLLTLSSAAPLCQPLWPRIFYGKSISTPTSSDRLTVYFNTAQPCEKSYAQLVLKSGLLRINCQTTALSLSKNTDHYQTNIHKCSTDAVNFEEIFHYNVFGWDGSSANPAPLAEYISAFLADPFNKSRKMKMAVLADWSKIELNAYKYTPVTDMLKRVQKEQQINGLVILGDIGYDLDTNNCSNYQKFFAILSDVASSIPIITVTGNHEYNTQDNWKLFSESFQLYQLDTELVVGLNLGAMHLLTFDPYNLLYGVTNKTEDKVAPKFDKLLKEAQNQGRFVVTTSHYPLACSGTSKNCANDIDLMSNYWNSMLDNGVSLYLGSHYHTYQRLYPYRKDSTFSNQADGYVSNGNYLISIVEGVAGNDKDIVESIKKIKDFTAAYTVNQTGFGVLEVGTESVVYRHLSTKQGEMDRISIKIAAKGQKMLLTE